MTKGERNAGKKVGKISIAPDVYELLQVSLEAAGQVTEDDNRSDGRHERGRLNDVVHFGWVKICRVKWFVTQSSYGLYASWRSV